MKRLRRWPEGQLYPPVTRTARHPNGSPPERLFTRTALHIGFFSKLFSRGNRG